MTPDNSLDGPLGRAILVSMGDACGIGPEIIARLWQREAPQDALVVADVAVMRRAVEVIGGGLAVAELHGPEELGRVPPRCLPVWQPSALPSRLTDAPLGRVDARAGAAAVVCIEAAVALIQAGRACGLVTAPIHKEALHAAGSVFPGHTEMLQALAGADGEVPPVRMMLANEELRTVLVTIHCSLRDAIARVTREAVLETLCITDAALKRMGFVMPRIAVAGLNPHAGEGGLFGDEEIRHIAPAIADARAAGMDASGPFAPDTVFMRARRGEFDVVVAMTHDHGLIPVKYLGVEQGVNVTLGLPFVRTSPDHGTAFDIAGRGVADPASLAAALAMARRLAA
ncbi:MULTISPECIES: 4-hydroxythreonine-4-phosphate dehydrogenase PdxA [unclassified Roseateles]|uniref:4-hydroxythreonine-4-phosphate dehydrogenase PdxA n=1 Tax=unclassified Roseateles TaxID=2626991 RepID=UPI0006F1DA07|nr:MULTISPECIES: 4-hydroxythreonine-4-phosphate dehydrogenase PdxA [unclassified Roseateles]KQW42796.1 4-hydroxythreonine-4-phosphate dehydrogenase [Pelomonas sp. Root405]KRA69473.1 4-hydroxythreonine-4-phosphate dehydrogenase [Pelomonas sp. Root662]